MDLTKLLEEEDDEKSQALLELNIRIAQKIESPDVDIFKVLSPTEICVILISRINVYVCNGGYEHYFYYSGMFANETIQAITKVGLSSLYENYLAAVNVFDRGHVPFEDNCRQDLIDRFTESQKDKLDEISDEYYGIDHLGDLFEYALKNQSDISV